MFPFLFVFPSCLEIHQVECVCVEGTLFPPVSLRDEYLSSLCLLLIGLQYLVTWKLYYQYVRTWILEGFCRLYRPIVDAVTSYLLHFAGLNDKGPTRTFKARLKKKGTCRSICNKCWCVFTLFVCFPMNILLHFMLLYQTLWFSLVVFTLKCLASFCLF